VNWLRRELKSPAFRELHYCVMRCGFIYIFFLNELLSAKAIQFTQGFALQFTRLRRNSRFR